ncbi:MAG: nucleoside monophosphate kinase [Patescibacteria group bacterium]|nr:nucleoside monophosphate kinase [Patescibacteria group bacterium]
MDTQTIFFAGKPGSGKGTQAKILAEKTGWKVVTPGEQFRAMSAEDSPVGRKVKEGNDAGLLQPPWLAAYIFLKALFAIGSDEGAMFDGAGRTVPEAELIVDALTWLGRPFRVLNLKVSDEEVHRRLALRREIESRADDHAVDKRLKEYHERTDPAIGVFRKAGVLIEINGEQSREAVAAEIGAALNIK